MTESRFSADPRGRGRQDVHRVRPPVVALRAVPGRTRPPDGRRAGAEIGGSRGRGDALTAGVRRSTAGVAPLGLREESTSLPTTWLLWALESSGLSWSARRSLRLGTTTHIVGGVVGERVVLLDRCWAQRPQVVNSPAVEIDLVAGKGVAAHGRRRAAVVVEAAAIVGGRVAGKGAGAHRC
jgi:hypothetical protein